MKLSIVNKITDNLPHDVICAALDVKPRSIRLARERQIFPANWYTTMRAICAEYGVDCPESAFNFKSPPNNPELQPEGEHE